MSRRRWRLGAALVELALIGSVGAATVGPGTSTEANAAADEYQDQVLFGESVFAEICSACHGASGEGFIGPPLIGPRALSGFRNAQRVYDFASRDMPADAPGTLSSDEYWAVIAYLLQQNGYNPSEQALNPVTATDVTFE
jgi:mono/diheme cytochrome c family protein